LCVEFLFNQRAEEKEMSADEKSFLPKKKIVSFFCPEKNKFCAMLPLCKTSKLDCEVQPQDTEPIKTFVR
jgi:hypothetical protein